MVDAGLTIHGIANQYQQRLRQREAAAEQALIRAYATTWSRVDTEVESIARDLQERFYDDQPLPEWRVREYERARILRRQVAQEVGQITEGYGATMTRLQAEAVVLGRGATIAMLAGLGWGDLVALPNTALIDLVGRLQDGSPLRRLLDTLGPEAAAGVEDALVAGLGRGAGPREVAREVRRAMGGNMARALTISRTEVVGSYRRASARQAREYREMLAGWTWLAAIDSPDAPCAVCCAMHGTWHSLDEDLHSHPNCRCTQAFLPHRSLADLGPTGEEWFDEQDEAVQLRILGPTAQQAYRNGDVVLADFVKPVADPEWGPGLRRRSNRELGLGRIGVRG